MIKLIFLQIYFFLIDYFDLFSWNNPKNILVYIPQHSYSDILKKAFEEWSDVTNHNIIFSYINSESNANIIISFEKQFSEWWNNKLGATHILSRVDNNVITLQMKIFITDSYIDDIKYNTIPFSSIYDIILHEIGHSLGLWKHSKNPNSIMYPEQNIDGSNSQKITKEEIVRLRKLYKF